MPFLLGEVRERGEDRQSHMGNSEIVIGWRKMGLPLWLSSKKKNKKIKKNLPAIQEMQIQSLAWEDPLEEGMQPTLGLLPG